MDMHTTEVHVLNMKKTFHVWVLVDIHLSIHTGLGALSGYVYNMELSVS